MHARSCRRNPWPLAASTAHWSPSALGSSSCGAWGAWPANPPGLSKGMMSSKLRRHNMTRDMTFNIPCSAGADSRFQKMVSMMDTCRAGGACVSSSMIWVLLYCIASIIAQARSSDSLADLQHTEAERRGHEREAPIRTCLSMRHRWDMPWFDAPCADIHCFAHVLPQQRRRALQRVLYLLKSEATLLSTSRI